MLVMVIEALASLADSKQKAGFELRDVSFHQPLKLPNISMSVETQLTLSRVQAVQDRRDLQSEFRIYVRENDNCIDICYSIVRLELEETLYPQSWCGCETISIKETT
jgi:hypothetical protein